jgi:hypothetical protein
MLTRIMWLLECKCTLTARPALPIRTSIQDSESDSNCLNRSNGDRCRQYSAVSSSSESVVFEDMQVSIPKTAGSSQNL